MYLIPRLYAKSSHSSSSNIHAAYMDVPRTFEEVGIAVPPGASGEIRTLCPNCSDSRKKSRDPCLAVNVTEGLWFCHHCGWKGKLWRQRYYRRRSARRALSGSAAPQPRRSASDTEAKAKAERSRRAMREVWHQALLITPGDPVAQYLNRRGLWQPPAPAVLRYHPALPYHYGRDEHRQPTLHPALVAAIQAPDRYLVSVHRIYLTLDGHKADVPAAKKFMTPTTLVNGVAIAATMNGAAIRLDQVTDETDELVVTEGLETALAVRLTTGMATWAALSAWGMVNIWIPETVHLVVIAADHDTHGKGEGAAQSLAQRLLRENRTRTVKICKPNNPGTDWCDGLEIRHHG